MNNKPQENKAPLMESPERKRLRELENEGTWVFHGSGVKVDILEPRQAHNHPQNSDEGKIPDGKPAVFASSSADVAIFMAIINSANASGGTRSGFSIHDGGKVTFRATQKTMDQLHNAKGYVYVFDQSEFTRRSSREMVSYAAVQPTETIEVTEKDLPKDILIKEF